MILQVAVPTPLKATRRRAKHGSVLWTVVGLALTSTLGACGGGGEGAQSPDSPEMCDLVKQFSQICYWEAEPNVSCDQVRESTARITAQGGVDGQLASSLIDLCVNTCEARKRGASWQDIESKLQESC